MAAKDDQVYVGSTCADDPIMTVHQLDPATDTWSTVFSFNPNEDPTGNESVRTGGFHTWITDISQTSPNNGYRGRNQGWLGDLEFFGNDITLGVRDRMGDLWGQQVPDPSGGLTNTIIDGDLYCAYFDTTSGSYVYPHREPGSGPPPEQTCGPNRVTTDPNPGTDWYGGEFYWGNGTNSYYGNTLHVEANLGALVQWGLDDLVLTMMTPQNAPGGNATQRGGIGWINNVDGAPVHAYELYAGDPGQFGKANGLGDIEALSLPAPIEIGNRVWHDVDSDGIQDAGESPISGVTVTLHDMDNGGALVGSAMTAPDGSYLFGGINDLNMISASVLSARNYEVRINLGDGALPVNGVTMANANGIVDNNNKTDLADSDATANGGNAVIAFTTGSAGFNNHTLDFGFYAVPPIVCDAGTDDLGGTVWRDYDSDGAQDTNKPGFTEPMVVSAYDNNGFVISTTTGISGTYLLDGLYASRTGDDAHIRLEFSGLPSWAQSGVQGANSGTTVQFHDAASCTADLAVQNPADYCQNNPQLATSCYFSGDPLASGANMVGDKGLVRFENSASGIGALGTNHFQVATVGQLGSTWGMAYDRNNDRIFVSEFLKRHVGLVGNQTGGAIYEITDPAGATPGVSTYLDFVTDLGIDVVDTSDSYAVIPSNSARNLNSNKAMPSLDLPAFELAGKASFGDLDISADGSTLYVVNLGDRRVYRIDLAQVDAGTDNATPLPAFPDPGCNLGVARPWALAIHDGLVHLGVVCTAENGGGDADLSAHVYAYDPIAGSWNTNSLIDIDLAFIRDRVVINGVSNAWNPWTDIFTDFDSHSGNLFIHPQPILADIEFDYEGSMHLAFLDRAGHQTGHFNVGPDNATYGAGITGGDIMRTYYDAATGQYSIEENATAGPYTSADANGGTGNCDTSNNCGEFYFDEYVPAQGQPAYHGETHSGGLAYIPGTTELAAITMDPIDDRLDAQGVQWYDITNGAQVREYEIFQSPTAWVQFSKSNGLGDLELLCDPAPLEIGNYIWLDEDGDGVQDPSEDPIAGVTVRLTDSSGVFTDTVTNGQGEYYFAVQPTSNYTLTIDMTQSAVSTYTLTTANVDSGTTLPDGVDSDAIEDNGLAVITLTTGNAGENDHTFDFGFVPPAQPALALDKVLVSPASGVAVEGETVTFRLAISNTGAVTVTELNLSDSFDTSYLQFSSASITPDTTSAGLLTWVGDSVAATGSLLSQLPLAPGDSFAITVEFVVVKP